MLKKTITYKDFNGDEVSEDFFFHISMSELVELEVSHQGGLKESINRIMAAEDGGAIMKEFQDIILTSYGRKSEDGKRFIKNEQLRDEFKSSQAYDTFFMDLVLNTDSMIEFINGVVPADMTEQMAKLTAANLPTDTPPAISVVPEPKIQVNEPLILTKADIAAMSGNEVLALGPRITAGEVVLGE